MAQETAPEAYEVQAYEATLQHWQTLAELQVQFVEALGQYKVEAARAELIQAVTAGEWAVARMKSAMARELEFSLKRLAGQRHATAREISRLQRRVRDAVKLRSGEDLPASQLPRVWAAYTVLERWAPADSLTRMLSTPLQTAARAPSNFVDPVNPHQTCPEVPPHVDNIQGLLAWMKDQRVLARRGSAAYRHVLEALAMLNAGAATEIERLTNALKELEQGTYNAWQPVAIAALPDNVDAKKIVRLGTK